MKTVFTILLLLCTHLVNAQEYTVALRAAKMDIDSAWERTVVPAADRICLPNESNLMRGKQLSDHDCIKNAINSARTRGYEESLKWLIAAHCYDPSAQDRVAKAGNDAVRYVMNQWGGGQQYIAGAAPAPAAHEAPPVLNISFTNHTGEWVHLFSLDTDQPDGQKACGEYSYLDRLATNRAYLRTVPKGRYVWIRFSATKDGCKEIIKEYKLGLSLGETMSRTEEIFVR